MKKLMSGIAIVLLTAMSTSALATNCDAAVPGNFTKVGQTRLSVLFWDVYDATLYSASGQYKKSERQVLKLHYLRDIDAADLIETTEEEWQKLGLEASQHDQWLSTLTNIWPDINEGDCLLLVETKNGYSDFYQGNKRLGTVESAAFTEQFLAIWLSPDSRFKEERNELVGAN